MDHFRTVGNIQKREEANQAILGSIEVFYNRAPRIPEMTPITSYGYKQQLEK
ncbi:hypothetical protein LY554_003978 [Salmonella enterica]|nr:hypothetical protein [Salmonella enterica]